MKRDMFNFAMRLVYVMDQVEKRNANTYNMFCNLLHENDLNSLICEDQIRAAEIDEDTIELDISEGYVDYDLYQKMMRAIRLLALVRRKPQEIMPDEADFLSGCPMKYESLSDDDIAGISFDPNVEAVDDRTFYYIWLIIGDFEEITMAAKVDSERGTVHPLPFIPIKSKYDVNDHTDDKPLTGGERKTMIDRIFYTSFIPDEIIEGDNEEISWLDEDDEQDEDDWVLENENEEFEDDDEDDDWWDGDDIDEEDEWEDDEDTDEEDEFDETDETDDGPFEWDEISIDDFITADTDDETEETSELVDKYRRFNYIVKNVKILSVTDMNGNERSAMEGAMYNNIQGFSGKIPEINIGERMCILYFEPIIRPGSQMKIHTSPVMFHSEELINENEIKHIVRTANSIYTFIEYKK